jgi:hypothetical protein
MSDPRTDFPDEGLNELADAPLPWPRVPGGAWIYGKKFRKANAEDQAAIFAEAEEKVSPDLQEWDWFLRGVRVGIEEGKYPDFKVPSRWDNWDLGKAMSEYIP